MRTIVAGSRHFQDARLLSAPLESLPPHRFPSTVLCGGATGADTLGKKWAIEHNIPVEYYPAHWSVYGKSAGPRRNRAMAENARQLVLFWNGMSPGSASMLRIARELELQIVECRI